MSQPETLEEFAARLKAASPVERVRIAEELGAPVPSVTKQIPKETQQYLGFDTETVKEPASVQEFDQVEKSPSYDQLQAHEKEKLSAQILKLKKEKGLEWSDIEEATGSAPNTLLRLTSRPHLVSVPKMKQALHAIENAERVPGTVNQWRVAQAGPVQASAGVLNQKKRLAKQIGELRNLCALKWREVSDLTGVKFNSLQQILSNPTSISIERLEYVAVKLEGYLEKKREQGIEAPWEAKRKLAQPRDRNNREEKLRLGDEISQLRDSLGMTYDEMRQIIGYGETTLSNAVNKPHAVGMRTLKEILKLLRQVAVSGNGTTAAIQAADPGEWVPVYQANQEALNQAQQQIAEARKEAETAHKMAVQAIERAKDNSEHITKEIDWFDTKVSKTRSDYDALRAEIIELHKRMDALELQRKPPRIKSQTHPNPPAYLSHDQQVRLLQLAEKHGWMKTDTGGNISVHKGKAYEHLYSFALKHYRPEDEMTRFFELSPQALERLQAVCDHFNRDGAREQKMTLHNCLEYMVQAVFNITPGEVDQTVSANVSNTEG